MSGNHTPQESPSPQTTEPPSKTFRNIFLVLLIPTGLLLLLVGGAMLYFMNDISKAVTKDPEEIRNLTNQIVEIDFPGNWEPESGRNFSAENSRYGFGLKQASWRDRDSGGVFSLGLITVDDPQKQKDLETKMDALKFHDPTGTNELQMENNRTQKKLLVGGEKISFLFQTGKDETNGIEYQVVAGTFPGEDGIRSLSLTIPLVDYNEQEILELIESIP